MTRLILHPGKERSVMRRHPWLFEGAVARLDGRARPGDTVSVVSHEGRPLGRAAYSPRSQIRARMWTFDAEETIDDAFFKRRIAASVARRAALLELHGQGEAGGLRLIHGESDGLPGIIADRYADTVVLALTSAGAEKWRSAVAGALLKASACARIYERSDSDVRGLEGLAPVSGVLHGPPIDAPLVIAEYGLRLEVDVEAGHKTGYYLDQRENRRLCGALAAGRSVLNCFCYTGGFSLQALAGGASEVLSIDSSGPALAGAQRNLALNPQLDSARAQWLEADVFAALRELRAASRRFDLIVLDPPKLAPSPAQVSKATRAYKDLNLLAAKLLNPGGILMTFSCSGAVSAELFQKVVAGAALDARRELRIVERLGQPGDHPVPLHFPEAEYLTGLVLQAD